MDKNKVISDLKLNEPLEASYVDQIFEAYKEDSSILNLLVFHKNVSNSIKNLAYSELLGDKLEIQFNPQTNEKYLLKNNKEDVSLELIEIEYADETKKEIEALKQIEVTSITLSLTRKNLNSFEASIPEEATELDIVLPKSLSDKLSKPFSMMKKGVMLTIAFGIIAGASKANAWEIMTKEDAQKQVKILDDGSQSRSDYVEINESILSLKKDLEVVKYGMGVPSKSESYYYAEISNMLGKDILTLDQLSAEKKNFQGLSENQQGRLYELVMGIETNLKSHVMVYKDIQDLQKKDEATSNVVLNKIQRSQTLDSDSKDELKEKLSAIQNSDSYTRAKEIVKKTLTTVQGDYSKIKALSSTYYTTGWK